MCFSKDLTFTLSFVIDFIVTNGIAFTVISTMVVLAQAVITALFRSTFIYICVFKRQIRYGLTKFITFNLCGCSPTFSIKNYVLKQPPRGRQQRKHQESRRTTLHVQLTFWFICLASLNDREVKYFNVKFHVGGKHRATNFPPLSGLRCDPYGLTSERNLPELTGLACWSESLENRVLIIKSKSQMS